MKQIVLGTQNANKLAEVRQILAPLDIDVVSLADIGLADMDVVEDGDTFEYNALKKAREYSNACSLPVLADDSGLSVDALNGAPGVYSARYGGEHANYQKNNEKLLVELHGVPTNQRKGQFICAMAYVDAAAGIEHTVRGEVAGIIIDIPLGEGGFGYDPLFYFPDIGMTFAQAPADVKHRYSHRGRALEQMAAYLKTL